jgi:hypothetical protein
MIHLLTYFLKSNILVNSHSIMQDDDVAIPGGAAEDNSGTAIARTTGNKEQITDLSLSLSQLLVAKAVFDLLDQYCESEKYRYMKVDESTFYVRRIYWQQAPDNDDRSKGIICRYDRTRPVEVCTVVCEATKQEIGSYLKCTCYHYQRCGRTCRHIYCIFNREPSTYGCSVQQTKMYEAHYGRNPEFTKVANTLIDESFDGPKLLLPLHFNCRT